MATFTHQVKLHVRSLSLTDVSFDTIKKSTEDVYTQYGIKIEWGPGMCLALSEDEAKKYEQVDGSCKWTLEPGERQDLQKLGGPIPSNEILVFYINRFTSGSLGCGGHMPNAPACIVAAHASRWDTAHEVGHVLLTSTFSPVHSEDTNNLMHATASTYPATPILTDSQVSQITSSPCCVWIPWWSR